MKRFASLPLVFAMILVGCSGGASDGATTTASVVITSSTVPSTTTSSTTTLPPTTTTTLPPTTSTTVPLPEVSVAANGFFPMPFPGSDDAHGSGCVVGGTEVPDGIWFGFIEGVDASAVAIDVACFWTGEAANSRAIADGEEPLDFYIRNNNPSTRSVPISATGTAYWLDGAGDLTPIAIPMSDWPSTRSTAIQDCPSDHCAAWIYVNSGAVTELVEQYLP